MCNKAVNTYPCTTRFLPDCYKTQEMCGKAVNTCFVVFHSVPNRYKTQDICVRLAPEDPFMLIYCPVCDEAAGEGLAILKFIIDCFVTSEIIEKFHDALLAYDDILLFDEDFSKVTFLLIRWVFLVQHLDKTDLDNDNSFYKNDPDTFVRFLVWRNKFEKRKALKKDVSKELMSVAWHPTRWWDWCISEDQKKEIEPNFTDKVRKS